MTTQQHQIIDQTVFDVKLNQAKLYKEQGLNTEADAVYEELLKILNNSPETKNTYSQLRQLQALRAKLNADKKKKKVAVKTKEISQTKKSNQDLYLEAMAFSDLDYHEKAIELYKELVQDNFKLYDSVYSIIDCNRKLGHKEDSKLYLADLIESQGTDEKLRSIAFYFLSFLYEEEGDFSHALKLIEKINFSLDLPDYENRKKFLAGKVKGKTKYDYLIARKIISKTDLKKAQTLSKQNHQSVEYNLITSFKVRVRDIGTSLSTFYGYPFIDLTQKTTINVDLFKKLKYAYLKNHHWTPFSASSEENLIEVAIHSADMSNQGDIRKIYSGYKLNFFIAVREHIDDYIDIQFKKKEIEDDETVETNVADLMNEISADLEIEYEEEEEIEEAQLVDSKVIMFVNKMLVDAHKKRASDIHIEPSTHTKNADIRFRIDGVCQPYIKIPNNFSTPIISRLKVMARMDITEKRKPLDGKIKFKSKNTGAIELRIATIPTAGQKEDMVIRLLQSGKPMRLKDLGVYDYNLNRLMKIIKAPYGLILAVGPTGSGKTTTLHSALDIINTPEKKIWTAEDPVEIDQQGIRQSEILPKIGVTFATLLRSFLRADPDVIMVGEMRDEETAKMGIEASLTGHLVFSTLHTNNAPTTVTRLLEMGIDPTNFADSLLGILAQRLGRRLCEHCKRKSDAPRREFKAIAADFGEDPFGLLNPYHDKPVEIYHPEGCSYCDETGYIGRIGFHELLINNEEIGSLIKVNATTEKIKDAAIKNSMYTLKQDGILKVLQGLTDIKEVRRNCM